METIVDRELLLEFFLTFSRFEYALKATDFLGGRRRGRRNDPRPPRAEPNWEEYARYVHRLFRARRTPELRAACEYLRQVPPWLQVQINGQPGWKADGPPLRRRGIEFILEMVRRVRNNLFHGGKYRLDPHETKERTELLLRNALLILAECLRVSPRVRRAYEEAVL
jgi:hypothetical protein